MSQKKAKFNIVDILVILILIAGAAFVGMRMLGGQEPAAANSNAAPAYLVTFRADCVPEEVAAVLTVGSKTENAERNMDLGTLVDCTIGESVTYGYDSKGNCVASQMPGHVSVTLVCQISGTQTPTGLQVGKYTLSIGHEMGVCCGNAEIESVVWRIAPAATE